MHFFFIKPYIIRISTVLFLIFILIGCDNNTSLSNSAGDIAPTRTPSQDLSVFSINQNTSFNLSSLNIRSSGFACSIDPLLYHSGLLSYAGGNVVLTDRSASYDVGTISHLISSLNKDDPSLLPKGFATALAGFTRSTPDNTNISTGCDGQWEITNTSQDIIQITQITLLYAVKPQLNTYHYNFVDVCSLPIQRKSSICGKKGGGVGGEYVSYYDFPLGSGNKGTVAHSQQTQLLSISPGVTVKVILSITPANASDPNYIYSIVPQLTLGTQSQPQSIPQLTNTVAFANRSLISCYQLQSNNTFLIMNKLLPLQGGNIECL